MSITIANNNITTSTDSLSINGRELVEVAFSGSYNDLVDKPSGGNSELLEVWVNDDHTQWYRKYSDGHIEQYGIISDVLEQAFTTITFIVPFTTSCNVLADQTRHNRGCTYIHGVQQESVSLSGFILRMDSWAEYGVGNREKIFWQAVGY